MHETLTPITAKEIAKREKVDIATIRLRWNANFGKGTFDSNRELSPEQVEILSRSKREKRGTKNPRTWTPQSGPNGKAFGDAVAEFNRQFPADEKELREIDSIIRTPAQHTVNQPAPAITEEIPPTPGRAKPTWILYVLLIGPIVASWHNMYLITHDLSGTIYDAVALTAVLSFSAIGFVWYGVQNWYVMALAALLIAYESFCNLTRIYGGLMGSGTPTGNPTRFVGLVTDIFGTGTHQTAIFLGAFTAFFIAAVQYAAVFELNKSK